MGKIQHIIKVTLGIRREIPVTKATRMYTGIVYWNTCHFIIVSLVGHLPFYISKFRGTVLSFRAESKVEQRTEHQKMYIRLSMGPLP